MTKYFITGITGLFISALSIAQPALAWDQHYNGPPDYGDEAVSIAVDVSGNSYVTGSAFAANGTLDMVTIKYSPSGQQLWLQSYNGTANDNDQAVKVVLDGSANVYVTGYSKGISSGNDITTIKYNSSGAQQWATTYNGSFNSSDQGASVAVDGTGNVFVTGFETSANNFYYDLVTLMYNSAGVQQWVHVYDGPGAAVDQGVDIVNDGNGNTYVVGTSDTTYMSAPNNDIVVFKYNNTGTVQWRRVYASPTYSYDIARKMCLDRNGNILICGYGGLVNEGNNFYTLKYNPAGSLQWFRSYNYALNTYEQPWGIVADSLNNVIVTGQGITSTTTATNDYVTVKYNSAGTFQWASRYDGPGTNNDYAYAVAMDDSLNIFVTGTSKGTGTMFDIATVKYDPSGNQLYVLRFDNATAHKDDAGNAMVVKNSDIYIAGRSSNLTNDDYVTLRYSYSAVGINENEISQTSLEIFPNPSHDEIQIVVPSTQGTNQQMNYTITNSLGQNIGNYKGDLTESIGSKSVMTLNVSGLTEGLYFITVLQGENVIGKSKFIVD